MFRIFKRRAREPQELAEQARRILSGRCLKWDIDDYENANVKDSKLADLHKRTFCFGLPEEWVKLDEAKKSELQGIIDEMIQLQSDVS